VVRKTFELDISENDPTLFALYRRTGAGKRVWLQDLDAMYPRALVKALFLADDGKLVNLVPRQQRVMRGMRRRRDRRNRMASDCLPIGKYAGERVRAVFRKNKA
jgi:hypothetical protein